MGKRKTQSELMFKALALRARDYPTCEIAKILGVSEAKVINLLRLG